MTEIASVVYPLVLLTIVAIAPFWARKQMRVFEQEVADGVPDLRVSTFAGTIRIQWSLTAGLFVLWLATRGTLESVYLVPGWSGTEWIAVIVGLAAAGLAVIQTAVVQRRPDLRAKAHESLGILAHLAPRTRREQRWFDGVSLTAGICEEVVYRGLLLGLLASWFGIGPAVVASSVLFGLGHTYQGAAGAFRIVLFGLAAALLTVFSGSIYLMVIVHTVVDMAQGRMLAAAADPPPADAAVAAVGGEA